MSQTSENENFARSLSGDWRARTRLYRKLIHENARVRRLGARYPDLNDFLHDCFTNVLRASHTFQDEKLSEQIEAVAVWTALERERLKETNRSGAVNVVRMCAAVEGDDAGARAQFTSYVPPRSGQQDTLPSRITAIAGEVQYTLLQAWAKENATWEDAAAAAGKPVNTIGPILVRAAGRLMRYFGAPPPLNDDLEPVFSDASRQEAATKKTDPAKPRGRVVAMQLDRPFYAVTPEMRRIGLTAPSEVRTLVLWEAARASTPPGEALRGHLDKCHYCSEVLRSVLLMQQALRSGPGTDFLFCPGASTLLQDPDDAEDALVQHLDECASCRSEQARGRGEELQSGTKPAVKPGMKPARKIAWIAAAAVILGGVVFAGSRYFTTRNRPVATEVAQAEPEPEPPPINVNPKYAALAQQVSLDDARVFSTVLPQNQLAFMEARADFKNGKAPEAMMITQTLVNTNQDPGAQMLYAACLFPRSQSDGYRAMQKAEAMPPRNSFRCWATLQSALLVGDAATAEREIGHLSSDPEYGARAKNILGRMRAIK